MDKSLLPDVMPSLPEGVPVLNIPEVPRASDVASRLPESVPSFSPSIPASSLPSYRDPDSPIYDKRGSPGPSLPESLSLPSYARPLDSIYSPAPGHVAPSPSYQEASHGLSEKPSFPSTPAHVIPVRGDTGLPSHSPEGPSYGGLPSHSPEAPSSHHFPSRPAPPPFSSPAASSLTGGTGPFQELTDLLKELVGGSPKYNTYQSPAYPSRTFSWQAPEWDEEDYDGSPQASPAFDSLKSQGSGAGGWGHGSYFPSASSRAATRLLK